MNLRNVDDCNLEVTHLSRNMQTIVDELMFPSIRMVGKISTATSWRYSLVTLVEILLVLSVQKDDDSKESMYETARLDARTTTHGWLLYLHLRREN